MFKIYLNYQWNVKVLLVVVILTTFELFINKY